MSSSANIRSEWDLLNVDELNGLFDDFNKEMAQKEKANSTGRPNNELSATSQASLSSTSNPFDQEQQNAAEDQRHHDASSLEEEHFDLASLFGEDEVDEPIQGGHEAGHGVDDQSHPVYSTPTHGQEQNTLPGYSPKAGGDSLPIDAPSRAIPPIPVPSDGRYRVPGSLLTFPALPPRPPTETNPEPRQTPARWTTQQALHAPNTQAGLSLPSQPAQSNSARKPGPKPAAAPVQSQDMHHRCRQRIHLSLQYIRTYLKTYGGRVPQPHKELRALEALQKVVSDQHWRSYLLQQVWKDNQKRKGLNYNPAHAPTRVRQGNPDVVDAALPAFLKHQIRVKKAAAREARARDKSNTSQDDNPQHSGLTGSMLDPNFNVPKMAANRPQYEPHPRPAAPPSFGQSPQRFVARYHPSEVLMPMLGLVAGTNTNSQIRHQKLPPFGPVDSIAAADSYNVPAGQQVVQISDDAQRMMELWEEAYLEPRLVGVTDPARMGQFSLERLIFRNSFRDNIARWGERPYLGYVAQVQVQHDSAPQPVPSQRMSKRRAPNDDDHNAEEDTGHLVKRSRRQ